MRYLDTSFYSILSVGKHLSGTISQGVQTVVNSGGTGGTAAVKTKLGESVCTERTVASLFHN